MTTTPAPSIAASLLTGTATGPFPTGFKYDAAANVRVYLELAGVRQPDLTAETDYTLTGATPKIDGGTVTLAADLVPADGWDEDAGDRVVIYRRTVKGQSLALPNTEGHKPAATEAALDKQMRAIEEVADQADLAVKAPVGEAGPTLPPQAQRTGKVAWFSGAALSAFSLDPGEVLGADPATGALVSMPLAVSVDSSPASVSSRTLAQAASWSTGAQFIQTQGHVTAGDGGAALWKRVGSEPGHAGKFQSADGAWWEIASPMLDVAQFGALGGGADDAAALALADDAATALGRMLRVATALNVGSDLTLAAGVAFADSGRLIPASGADVWLAGGIFAGETQIFDLSEGGKIVLPDQLGEVWAAWWGLSEDRVDNEVPVQQAITALEGYWGDRTSPLAYSGGKVKIGRGRFKTSGEIIQRNLVRLVGVASRYSILQANPDTWSGARMLYCNNFDIRVDLEAITQANPAVVTATDHGLDNGDVVRLEGVGGMVEVEGADYVVANVTADTFELTGTDSTGFTAFTTGGTATRYGSQFGVRIEELTLNAGGIAEIDDVVVAESWNEQCGIERCLLHNFQRNGVKVREGYGGASVFNLTDTEISGNLVGLSTAIDVELLVGFSSGYCDLLLTRVTLTGTVVGVQAKGKVRVVSNGVFVEDADICVFLSGAARLCGSALKAQRATTEVIGLDTDWSGRIDALPVVQGPASRLLHDYRAGKGTYTLFDGEFLPGPVTYPTGGGEIFGGEITAGGAPAIDGVTQLSAATREGEGWYRCTLAAGFSMGAAANYYGKAWVTGDSSVNISCALSPQTATIFDIVCRRASDDTPLNVAKLGFSIHQKP